MNSRIALTLIAGTLVAALQAQSPVAERARQIASERLAELGLDQDHGFKVRATALDKHLGEEDVRVQQQYRGVKVFGGEAVLHMANGALRHMTDGLERGLHLETTPTLDSAEALAIAHEALKPQGPYAYPPTAELVIAPMDADGFQPGQKSDGKPGARSFKLAYHVHTELENGAEETAHTDFLVDAHNGEILDRWSTLRTTAVKGTGISQFSGTVTLDTNSTSSGFELRDLVRSVAGNAVYDLNHATTGTGSIYTDLDNAWGDGNNYTGSTLSTTGPTGQTAAVDAAYGLAVTWDMFKNVFGRNGIDGTGRATHSRVHYSTNHDNAFWNDSCFCMTFGDGSSFKSLESLDVVAHEMGHGVCANTSNLIYRGESGGLNEANSDIVGTMAEFYAYGAGGQGTAVPDQGGNYTIGEALATPAFNSPLRFMYKPSLDGYSPNWWSRTLSRLDVHYSNGPALLWFFLLSHGSQADALSNNVLPPMTNGVTSVTGIGNHKAAQIWYRALSKYMISSTDYVGARTATLSAAADLFGATSAEYATVDKAWLAVNVKGASTTTTTKPTGKPK